VAERHRIELMVDPVVADRYDEIMKERGLSRPAALRMHMHRTVEAADRKASADARSQP